MRILWGFLCFVTSLMVENSANATPGRYSVNSSGRYVTLEFLSDRLIHFETGPGQARPGHAIELSPMIAAQNFAGTRTFEVHKDKSVTIFQTAAVRTEVDDETLCIRVIDRPSNSLTASLCPLKNETGFVINRAQIENVYGLGQQFVELGVADGDWIGRKRFPGNEYGNAMVAFHGGFNPNTQIPIMYAVGSAKPYALFLDDVYPLTWDFTIEPWTVKATGKADEGRGLRALRGFIFAENSLPELRRAYMNLVGHSLVPPLKLFGLWISEWGYDNWRELDDKLRTLEEHKFPVDGAILDLQWFGGINGNNENTRMGSLDWDRANFPEPEKKIAELREQGLGLSVIEESYVGKSLAEHKALEDKGYLAQDPETHKAAYLTMDPWWGLGGMIDWTNPAAGDAWHDWKRQKLIDDGVLWHWADLGEPELYNDQAVYFGVNGKRTHADVHNLYSFYWVQSIYRGYERHHVIQRPFTLLRSGAAGMQRYGGALWSADISANLENYRTHLNTQMQMSLSGMDYYGSDTGGFYRDTFLGPDYGELYTQWFANSAAFDIPLRVHAKNLCNCYETAPDRNGDVASNLSNLRQRYELNPYYYSLAHAAYRAGEPIVAPMVYYFENDKNARTLGSQKMIGAAMLIASVAEYGATTQRVYLPAGLWIDYFNHRYYASSGQSFEVPVVRDGLFKLPVFVRAGGIIPKAYVDEQTKNNSARRRDGTLRDDLIVRVYPGPRDSGFTLYEDDGVTNAYVKGAVRTTLITQATRGGVTAVTLAKASGTYTGAKDLRDVTVEFVSSGEVNNVHFNGEILPAVQNESAWGRAPRAWMRRSDGLIVARVRQADVHRIRAFEFKSAR